MLLCSPSSWPPHRSWTVAAAPVPHWVYPPATPITPTGKPWHTGEEVDEFWGPSSHWNEGLHQYVMLMNRGA
jgi:hypothetical protein